MRQDVENLARHVEARRRQLHLTAYDIPERGGPSYSLVVDLLNGKYKNQLGPKTSVKFDEALEWEPGSAGRALEGGEPVALEHAVRPVDGFAPDELIGLAFCKTLLPQLERHLSALPAGHETRRHVEIATEIVRGLTRRLESPQTNAHTQPPGESTMLALVDAAQAALPDLPPTPEEVEARIARELSL